MGKLSELVRRDYDSEVKIIQETGGNLWLFGLGVALVFALLWGFDTLIDQPWTKFDICSAIVGVVGIPFISRAWERHKVAAQMRHEREVRVEIKLDALLGLVNIKDVEDRR